MEATVRQKPKSSKRKPKAPKLVCGPCVGEGKTVNVEGYCVECEDYLCGQCFQVHHKTKKWRNHQLVKKQQPLQKLRTKSSKTNKDDCTDRCIKHEDKILEYFCEDHSVFGCSVCMTLDHRKCEAAYIPELAEHLFESPEYENFKSAVESLAEQIKSTQSIAARNLVDLKIHAAAATDEVKRFRKEINTFFDKLEKQITDKVDQIQKEDRIKTKKIAEQCKALDRDIKNIERDIKDKESKGQRCQMFVEITRLGESFRQIQNDTIRIEKDNNVRRTQFIPSTSVANFIRDPNHWFGTLVSFRKTLEVHMDIDTKDSCDVTDLAMFSNGRLVAADTENQRVKILDTKFGLMATSTEMGGHTRAVTAISDHEIAVAQDGNIEIYSVSGGQIELKKTIQKADLGWALVYANNKFIGCTFTSPYRIQMVSMKGEVMKTYPTQFNGEDLFVFPMSIAISPDNSLIYVSDFNKQTVTCLSIEGKVKAQYSHKKGWYPTGVAVSRDGLVYVNERYKNGVHILTADLKEVGVIDGKRYGIVKPKGIACCHREEKIYVGMKGGREIVVLNI